MLRRWPVPPNPVEQEAGALTGQIALASAAAITVGLLDAAVIMLGLGGARGSFEFVPGRIWIVAPLVWTSLAAFLGLVALLASRRKSGLVVTGALALIFLVIRLRAHPVMLLASIAVLAVAVLILGRWLLRLAARPRRSAATVMLGSIGLAALIAVAPPRAPRSVTALNGIAAPNVILIFLDTVRYDALFDTRGRVHSHLPALARLQGESTTFTRAYSTSPWTLPSHLSAVTGLPAHQLDVSFDDQVYTGIKPTLAEHFRGRGYRTAAIIANSFLNAGSGFARGYDTFRQAEAALDICRTAPGVVADTYWPWFSAAVCNWTGSSVTRRALELLDDDEGPLFLTLNYMDAHDPYYVERSCGADEGYRAAIVCLDRNLGPIVDWRSRRRSTVLVVVGDHGEQFGEHGLQRHGNSLYVQLLHVPLMIRRGAGADPDSSTAPISVAAVPALLGVADAPSPHDAAMLALLHPPAAANLPSEWSALDGSWHLIVRERGTDGLFHLPTDPGEVYNLVASDPADPAIDRLRAAIAEMRRAPRPDLGKFRSLGYVH